MKCWLRILAPGIFGAFLALALWRIIVHGLMEHPSFEAPHFEAGAGNFGLLVALSLAVVAFVFAAVWLFVERQWQTKALAVALAVVTPALFVFSARGLQRFASRYSEEAFQKLVALHASQSPLQAADVTSALGEPLMRRKQPDGSEDWLYSYMPSCGFGWDRKFVFLDPSGRVADIFTSIEP